MSRYKPGGSSSAGLVVGLFAGLILVGGAGAAIYFVMTSPDDSGVKNAKADPKSNDPSKPAEKKPVPVPAPNGPPQKPAPKPSGREWIADAEAEVLAVESKQEPPEPLPKPKQMTEAEYEEARERADNFLKTLPPTDLTRADAFFMVSADFGSARALLPRTIRA